MNRFYRLLLHLYPTSFRAEYGEEMARAFAARTAGEGALATFGSAIADVVPNAVASHWDILRADLRQASRTFRRSPGFAITAILVVALGVGANTAAFSVADFVLLRPLPFPHPEQLVTLKEATPGYNLELSPGNFRDWQRDARAFSSMSAYFVNASNLTGSGEPRRIDAANVSWNLFRTLGASPMLGRTWAQADTVDGQTVVISEELWRTQFGADDKIVGKKVRLEDNTYTVIGVMPSTFNFPNRSVKVWSLLRYSEDDFADRGNNYIIAVGRLRDGATLEEAQSQLSVIQRRLAKQFPDQNKDTDASATSLSKQLGERARLLLYALCGASLCVLLLACANLGNLVLARAMSREREIAVRAALGAGRERIIRQIATENLLLSAVGGVIGVLVAIVSVPALTLLVPNTLPIAAQPEVDLRVLGFAALLVIVTGLAFSVFPALRAANASSLGALRDDAARSGGGTKQRVRSTLVVVEVMASVVLLISSGLLVRALWRLQAIDPGFRTENVLTMRTALPWPRYGQPLVRQQFYTRVLDGIRALPGVQSAAYVTAVPMAWRGGIWAVKLNGGDDARNSANSASLRFATPQYFDALRIPVKLGRDVQETDVNGSPNVAVVSESFVKRYWPSETPIGKHFTFAMRDRQVVGVVGDIRVRGLEQSSEPQVYLPYKQVDSMSLIGYTPKDLVVRSTLPTATLLPEVRRIVRQADPLQPISDVQTMEQIVTNETASRAAQLRVLMILAAIAVLLSAVGIHGLLSYTVSRRSREIGVRMALGAEASRVRAMIVREGVVLAVAGVIPGALLAYAAGRGMEALLAGVQPGDAVTFSIAVAICAVMTILGCVRPAFRASRVDPMTAIRAE